jgi:hypothetical protein
MTGAAVSQPVACGACVHRVLVTSMRVDPKYPLHQCARFTRLRLVGAGDLPVDCPGGKQKTHKKAGR